MIADKFAMLPLDIDELNPLNKDEYELIMDSLPVRLDRSSCTKFVTVLTAPGPPPPPPQAVNVVAIMLDSNMFFAFFTVIYCP